MKTLLTVLLLSVCASAQSYTVVTATLQDSSGQVWSQASWRTEFAPQPGYSGQYNNQGAPITAAQSGTADNAGTFHVTLDNNIVVSPSGSSWKFIICPNASVSSCSTINLTIFGPIMNVSSQLNAVLTVPIVFASPVIAHAYNDTEVNGSYGTLYINAIDNTLRECLILQCNGGGWVAISASTSNPTFTGTLTVPCVKFNFDASNDSTLCSQGGTGHINFLLPTVGGTLLTSATAGNVSNSGTPLVHQVPIWVDATHILGTTPGPSGGCFMSNGLLSDPSFQNCPLVTTGTPLNHQIAAFTAASTVQGISPSTAGFVLTSNGIAADPTFQAAAGGGGSVVGSGIPAMSSGSEHFIIFNNSATLSSSSGNNMPGGLWSHLGGTFVVSTNVASNLTPPFYNSATPSGSSGNSSLAEDAVAAQFTFPLFGGYMCYCAWQNTLASGSTVWLAISSTLYSATAVANPNGTIWGFRWVSGTDTNVQAYVGTASGTFTVQDAGVPPDGNFHQYFMAKNSSGDIDFYIDGVKKTTILHSVTGFPGNTASYPQTNIGTGSTTSQVLNINYFRAWYNK